MIRVKQSGERGELLRTSGNRHEVQFHGNGTPYRVWFSAEELEVVPTPDNNEIAKAFANKFTKKMDATAKPMTSSSEERKINPRKDKKP
jgi:hypothetical protein